VFYQERERFLHVVSSDKRVVDFASLSLSLATMKIIQKAAPQNRLIFVGLSCSPFTAAAKRIAINGESGNLFS